MQTCKTFLSLVLERPPKALKIFVHLQCTEARHSPALCQQLIIVLSTLKNQASAEALSVCSAGQALITSLLLVRALMLLRHVSQQLVHH